MQQYFTYINEHDIPINISPLFIKFEWKHVTKYNIKQYTSAQYTTRTKNIRNIILNSVRQHNILQEQKTYVI